MNRRLTWLAFVLVLLVPSANAEVLEYESWETQSASQYSGNLHALLVRASGVPEAPLGVQGAFESAVLTLDRSEILVTGPANDPEESSTTQDYQAGEFNLIDGGSDFVVFLHAIETAIEVTDSGRLQAEAHEQLMAQKPGTPASTRGMQSDIRGTDCVSLDRGSVRVTGSFLVSFYGLNGSIDGNQVWTGETYTPPAPGLEDVPYGGTTAWQEAFLNVTNGWLAFTATPDVSFVYLEPRGLSFHDTLNVFSLPDPAVPITIQGPANVTFDDENRQLVVAENFPVTDSLVEQDKGGLDSETIQTTRHDDRSWWWAFFAIPALPGTIVGATTWRRHRQLIDMRDGLRLGALDLVEENARSLLQSPRHMPEAALAQATAYVARNELLAAENLLSMPRIQERVPRAAREYVLACIRSRQGDMAKAAGFLASATKQDPGLTIQAASDPWLASLVKDSSLEGYS